MLKKAFCIWFTFLAMILFSCEKRVVSSDNSKEVSTLSNDVLVKGNDKKKNNNSTIKEEFGEIVFEVPGYYDQRDKGVESNGLTFDVVDAFEENDTIGFIGFKNVDGTYTEFVKTNKTDIIKSVEGSMDVIIKTEDSMVGNNYIFKIMGSKGENILVWGVLVNDSANKGVIILFFTNASD